MHLPFTKELRMIEEVQRVAGDVNYLTINHLQLLLTVYDMETAEGLEAQQLAAVTGHHKSTVNRIIHSLGAKRGRGNDKSKGLGLLEVRTDENDSRIRRIHITPYGKRLKKILLEVAGKDDEEAKQMATHMQAVMFESKSNVIEAKASLKVHTTMKAEGIVAGKGEVGEATIKVTGQDAEMRHEAPETIHPKAQASLERSIRNAATKGLESIRYKGIEVPLIDIGLAQKLVKDGKLHKDLVLGMWAYFDNPVAADYASTPNYFQADLSGDEMQDYANSLTNQIANSESNVVTSLEKVGETLNNHQRKWVVNSIVKSLGDKRTEAMERASKLLDSAAETKKRTERVGEEMFQHEKMMQQNFGNPTRENHHFVQMVSADKKAKELFNEFDDKIADANKERNNAARLSEIEAQMAKLMLEIKDIKDDE